MINKKEEIAILNHIVSETSLIYTLRKGDNIELFEYPSKKPKILYGITGGLNYFKKRNIIYVNDLTNRRYFKVTGDEIEINEGCITQVNKGEYFILKYPGQKGVTLLDANFNELKSLSNFPENFYESIFYQGYLFVVSDSIKNKVVDNFRSIIFRYDLRKDNVEEFFDAEEFIWSNANTSEGKGFVRQLICGFEDSLIVEVSKYHIVCFNINSGKILWEISNFVSNEEYAKFLSYGASNSSRTPMKWLKDERNNRLLLLARHFYWSVDLLSREVRLESDFLDSMVLNRWNIQRTSLVGNEILFIGTQGFQTSPNRIGIYDVKRKEVIWQYQLKSGYLREAPRFINGCLVVLDNNSNLHIFTKDDQEV